MVHLRRSSRSGKDERARLRKATPTQPPQLPALLPNLASLTLDDPVLRSKISKQAIIPKNEREQRLGSSDVSRSKAKAVHIGPVGDPYCEAVAERNALHDKEHEEYGLYDEKHSEDVLRNGKHGRDVWRNEGAVENYGDPVQAREPAMEDDRARAEREMALGRSEDVETHVSQAAPVTHETRIVNTHEIITQPITREIHNHHYIHRVQPIQEIEVLPPRHFMPSKSGRKLIEIPPPESSKNIQKYVQQAFESQAEESRMRQRRDVKSDISGQQSQRRDWISSEGINCSESVWIHEPQLDNTAKDAGETVPLHVGRVPEEMMEGGRD